VSTLACCIASGLLELYTAVVRPTSAECPRGWWLPTGVQRDGSFVCERLVVIEQWPPIDAPDGLEITSRIYCGKGRAVQDGTKVWCRGTGGAA
jgi:hypothetical protein